MAVSIHVHENLIMLYLYNQIEKGKYKILTAKWQQISLNLMYYNFLWYCGGANRVSWIAYGLLKYNV